MPADGAPLLYSMCQLLQLLFLLLNRLACLHSRIQSLWHDFVKTRKDIARLIPRSERARIQGVVDVKAGNIRATWETCERHIKLVKSHMGASLPPVTYLTG